MTELFRVAAELQAFCEANGWRFCFIGGLALQQWGEPRETVDVDLTLLTGFGGEDPFIEDIALAGLPFEESVIERSRPLRFPGGAALRVCSPEDLIILKAFASRSRDWLDIEGVIARQTGKLDWARIRHELEPLAELKEAPEILTELERRRVEFER